MRSAWTCRGSETKFTNLIVKQQLPRSLFQHVQTLCICPVSLTCIPTQQQAMWRRLLALSCTQLAVETLPIDRWHDRTTRSRRSTRSVAIDLKHETLPANRARLLDQTGAKQWPLFSRSRQSLSGHDRSNARRPRTGRGRGPWWRRGGVVSLDGRCSAQAEQRKKPVAVGPLPGAYLSTETNLVPIRGVMRKEFDTGHTHTHTHTHAHGIKALWTARSTALRARDPRQE